MKKGAVDDRKPWKTRENIVVMACNPMPFIYVKHFHDENGIFNGYD